VFINIDRLLPWISRDVYKAAVAAYLSARRQMRHWTEARPSQEGQRLGPVRRDSAELGPRTEARPSEERQRLGPVRRDRG